MLNIVVLLVFFRVSSSVSTPDEKTKRCATCRRPFGEAITLYFSEVWWNGART